ncbi:hypothetical protein RchiOBHm_Chr6g0297461 [Rosa chinensis]|uniref:Uncharacterized protein n=1 Tax=Rosa chinensis TaxID=74649 RepID=A0A2P6PXN7_ROSCH|nr:uncharacterized protein LOC121048897 [Rosa chinensis]PRQ26698.1 hypothetical protein RchiOBHm_Chr6g0297461 [Rosa chinensis]
MKFCVQMQQQQLYIMKQFLCAVFLFGLNVGGQCFGCSVKDISIEQSQTGKSVKNKPEWNVTIANGCSCSQLNVKLACDGFQTVEDIDPSILSVSGGECLVKNGQPVYANGGFNFFYAWDTSFSFNPISSQIACS